jgi:hypothetical protein
MILFKNELICKYCLYICICMKWSRNSILRSVSMDVLTEY